jgi:predicted TPR repeat methyltransferase
MSLFQTHYQEPYKLYARHVAQFILRGSTIVDLGCDVGVLADLVERVSHGCTIHCVDMNAAALATLASKARNYSSTTVQCYHADANTFLQRDDIRDINLVVVHAALHEINAVENQRGYLELFFARALTILAEQGKIFIGDFFYPLELPDKDVNAYMETLRVKIGHADPRERFVSPVLLRETAEASGLREHFSLNVRAALELDRRYYEFVFERGDREP